MTVDVSEVDASFLGLSKGVESPDHVAAVQAQIQSQVVPRSSRHNHHGNAAFGRHSRHHRLRSVTAGHADHVGAGVDGRSCQLLQIVARADHHHFDAALIAVLDEVVLLHLPAARLQVHDKHAVDGRRNSRPRRARPFE